MTQPQVRIGLRGGWCSLAFHATDPPLTVRTHSSGDGFVHLLRAVLDLAAGRPAVSVRWPEETGGGHFLDLVADPHGSVHVAVHEMTGGPGEDDPLVVWNAVRGELVGELVMTLSSLVRSVAHELQRIRIRQVDPTSGMAEQWPRTFPTAIQEHIEQIASERYGFTPYFPAELDHYDPE